MTVTFRSAANTTGGTGTSLTLTAPASTVSGDVIVAMYVCAGGGNPALPPDSSGNHWTQLYAGQAGPSNSGGMDWIVGYCVRNSSAPSYAFTHTGSIFREGYAVAGQTSGGTITLDAQSADGSTYNDTANPDPPAVTAVAASSLCFAVGAHWQGWGSQPTCSGYTRRAGGNAFDGVIFTKSLSASGSENPAQFSGTIGVAEDAWNGASFTFTDAGAAAGQPAAPRFRMAEHSPFRQLGRDGERVLVSMKRRASGLWAPPARRVWSLG